MDDKKEMPTDEKESQYIMAVVKPKHSKAKRWILKTGIAFFCGGLGIGSGFAVTSILLKNPLMISSTGLGLSNQGTQAIRSEVTGEQDNLVVQIAKEIGPCVVSVYNNKMMVVADTEAPYHFTEQQEVLSGFGSGVVFDEDADYYYIMTNSHVIEGADSLSINFLGDIAVSCTLVGKDSVHDIAVVKVEKKLIKNKKGFKVGIAPLGDSDLLEAGQLAVAIGTPSTDALNNTITKGIISATHRTIIIAEKVMTVVQTDAAINPGSSGGALVGATGEVIGINVGKKAYMEGIGFAIPINVVKPIVVKIMQEGDIIRPALGITGQTITDEQAKQDKIPIGVHIQSIITEGSAALSGIKSGDILLEFEDQRIINIEQLKRMLNEKYIGDSVEVKVWRDGIQKTFQLKLKEMPE